MFWSMRSYKSGYNPNSGEEIRFFLGNVAISEVRW